MNRPYSYTIFAATLAVAGVLAGGAVGPAAAQGVPQTISLVRVDTQALATGYRTSKVVGSAIVNEVNESIGSIDDLIVTPNEKVPFAILSVGGFLGLGTHYVVVPFSSLEVKDGRMMLRGATKESLKALPEFKYRT